MSIEQDYRRALLVHPFWDSLSPTAARQRVEQLLTAPNSAELVQAMSPVEYAILLKASPDMQPVLLALGHPEQIRTVLDLDCWQADHVQSTRVLAWLEELQRSGDDSCLQTLYSLDRELLFLTFRQHVQVHATLPNEEELEPRHYDEVLANELYRLEFVDPESPWNERIRLFLAFLRQVDLDFYYGLMQGTMWSLNSELEDWAYRWKSGRLQDEGFPDYYEAVEDYTTLDTHDATLPVPEMPLVPPAPPVSAEESGVVPSYAWRMPPTGSLLAQALSGDLDTATLERLCWEMVALCNRELVIDQVDFADANAVRISLQRVQAYLNVGLEQLGGRDPDRLRTLLTTHTLHRICQAGLSLSLRLHQRANHLQHHLSHVPGIRRALPGLARQVLDALLCPHPQFFVGLETPGETGQRDFFSLRDITQVDTMLRHLEQDPAYAVPPATSSVSDQ